jgi:spore coat polysaccharide biosynthesis protein SpsF (cytidylyltransferase family)
MGRLIGVVEIPPVRSRVASWSHSPLLSPRRLGGQTLLGWIVDRVRQTAGLDDVVVVTDGGQLEIARARVPSSVRLYDYFAPTDDSERRDDSRHATGRDMDNRAAADSSAADSSAADSNAADSNAADSNAADSNAADSGAADSGVSDGGAGRGRNRDVDALGRFAALASELSASALVRVVAGHPFVDPQLIERLVAAADRRSACDYTGFLTATGRRSMYMRLGMVVEWVGATALEQAARQALDDDDRRDATRYIHSHPDLFQLRWLPLPPPFDRRDIRLSLEQHEDWEHAQVIFEALGAEGLSWPRIATLVGNNPTLRARMERLNRVDRV